MSASANFFDMVTTLPIEKKNRVLAIDPGREKCGVAVVDKEQGILLRRVIANADLSSLIARLIDSYQPIQILLGNGTGHALILHTLQNIATVADPCQKQPLILLVDEYGTTEAARRRYWREHPPRGWRRLLPLGLQTPPVPVDDYVAVILAERFFSEACPEIKKKQKNKKKMR